MEVYQFCLSKASRTHLTEPSETRPEETGAMKRAIRRLIVFVLYLSQER